MRNNRTMIVILFFIIIGVLAWSRNSNLPTCQRVGLPRGCLHGSGARLDSANVAAKPLFETCLAKLCVTNWHKRVLTQLRTEIFCLWVGDNLARILAFGQPVTDEFIETKPLRPGDFKSSIQWLIHRDLGYGTGNILGRDGLKSHRWDANSIATGGGVSDGFAKLEELRRVD